MTTDEATQRDAARARAEELLGGAHRMSNGGVWFNGVDGGGFETFKSSLTDLLVAHARELATRNRELGEARKERDQYRELEEDMTKRCAEACAELDKLKACATCNGTKLIYVGPDTGDRSIDEPEETAMMYPDCDLAEGLRRDLAAERTARLEDHAKWEADYNAMTDRCERDLAASERDRLATCIDLVNAQTDLAAANERTRAAEMNLTAACQHRDAALAAEDAAEERTRAAEAALGEARGQRDAFEQRLRGRDEAPATDSACRGCTGEACPCACHRGPGGERFHLSPVPAEAAASRHLCRW